MVIEQVTVCMRFSPIGDSLSHHIVAPLVNAACMTVLVHALRSEYSTEGMEPINGVSCNERQKQPSHNRPLSEVFMMVSSFFCRSVAGYQHIAVVSFAENGRFSGPTKDGLMFLVPNNQKKTAFS